ncbi:hypothetical protein ABK040_014414 [Willaertia magna]
MNDNKDMEELIKEQQFRIQQDLLDNGFISTFIYKEITNTQELLKVDNSNNENNNFEENLENVSILTPNPSIRYFIIERDLIYKCYKIFIGILDNSSPLKGFDHQEIHEEFIDQLIKPIEFSGYTTMLLKQVNNLEKLEEKKDEIKYLNMNEDEINEFKEKLNQLYWFGFDCNHSLALSLLAMSKLNLNEEMFIHLMKNSALDFIDVSPMEFEELNKKEEQSTEELSTTTKQEESDLNYFLKKSFEFIPERTYKNLKDSLQIAMEMNQILYFYEELLRQEKYLRFNKY